MNAQRNRLSLTLPDPGQPELPRNLQVYADELGVTPAYVGGGLWAYVVRWTPELAASALQHRNPGNRRPDPSQIEALSRDMGAAGFYLTGESLLVSTDGNVCDGQNRLNAVVKSQTEQDILTVFGMDWKKVFPVIGHGKKRDLADLLYLEDQTVANVKSLAATVRNCWLLAHTRMSGRSGSARSSASDETLLNFNRLHPDIAEANCALRGPCRCVVFEAGKGFASAMLWILKRIDRSKALEMFQTMADNAMPKEPRWDGPRRFCKRVQEHSQGEGKNVLDRPHYRAYLTLAWNAFYEGRSLDVLSWKESQEQFPMISGLAYDSNRVPFDTNLGTRLPKAKK